VEFKKVQWLGDSLDILRASPSAVRDALGAELGVVQRGRMPTDFKPMPAVGKGAFEIRVHLEGAWRLIFVAKFKDAIYVLHAFQKKTQQTPKADIDLARARYRSIGE
jgi:phage-related protein